jgi:hypothetical protein
MRLRLFRFCLGASVGSLGLRLLLSRRCVAVLGGFFRSAGLSVLMVFYGQ